MTTLHWITRILAAMLLVTSVTLAVGASPVDDLIRVLPDDLLFFAATSGSDALGDEFDQAILGRVWNDPSTQAFFTSAWDGFFSDVGQTDEIDAELLQEANALLRYAQLVLGRPVAVGLARTQNQAGLPGCLFAIVDAGDRKDDLAEMIAQAEAALEEFGVVDTEVRSLKMRRVRDDDGVPLYWGWVGRYLVVAANDTEGDVIEHLAKPREVVLPHLERCPGQGDVLTLYYDHPETMRAIEAFLGRQDDEDDERAFAVAQAVLADLGLAKIGTVAAKAEFSGPDLEYTVYVQTPEPRSGLLAVLNPMDPNVMELVDARALVALAFNCNLSAIYDTVMQAAKTAAPDEAVYAQFQESRKQFEAMLGFSLRDDLLASFAGPVLVYSIAPGRMLDVPAGGFVATVALADASRFEGIVTRIIELAQAELGSELLVGTETDEAGHVIGVCNHPVASLAGWMPSWCVVEDQLVLGSNVAMCELGIARIESGNDPAGSLTEAKGYADMVSDRGGELLSLRYVDSGEQFRQTMLEMQQAWSMAAGLLAGEEIRLPTTMPSLDHLLSDMGPSWEASHLRPDGVYVVYRGPGLDTNIGSLGVASLAMGMLMPAMVSVRRAADEMAPSANLSAIGGACLLYAIDHEDQFPPNLELLVEEDRLEADRLESDRKPEGFDGPSYIYVPGHTVFGDPSSILAYENPEFCPDGVNVVFSSMDVKFMTPEEFRDALAETYERLHREMPEIHFGD